ncbi:hypothetical protein [Streptosporangium sp. V21-05]|uniref:hypothetical protein n=1 Tax=Streptosporangium sp. V21-05 TaxID=3446115 RepID=UPI003F53AEEA
MTRACGVLNFSALIASDSGMPDLATELCWRQHKVFAEAESLDQDIAVMSLMPLVNMLYGTQINLGANPGPR